MLLCSAPVKSKIGVSNFYNYEIENSLLFNSGNSSQLVRTPTSTGNNQVFTISMWFKRSNLGTSQILFSAGSTSSVTGRFYIGLNASNQLDIAYGACNWRVSNRVFRDCSSWYHLTDFCNECSSKYSSGIAASVST